MSLVKDEARQEMARAESARTEPQLSTVVQPFEKHPAVTPENSAPALNTSGMPPCRVHRSFRISVSQFEVMRDNSVTNRIGC